MMAETSKLLLRALLGLLISLGLGVGGLMLISGGALVQPHTYRLLQRNPSGLSLVAGVLLAQWWLPAARLWLLARPQGASITCITAFALHLIYMLGSAITPGGSGGGPALASAWRMLGMPWGRGVAIAVQIFVLDITVLALLAATGGVFLVLTDHWHPSFQTSVLVMIATAAASLALVLATAPRRVTRGLLWAHRWWHNQRPRGARRVVSRTPPRAAPGAPKLAREYLRAALALHGASFGVRCSLWLVNFGAWTAHFAVLWALLKLSQPTPLLPVMASLAIASLAAVAVPTPGASGVMEVVVGLGVLAHYEAERVAAPILLWRVSTFYLVYLLGPIAALGLALTVARRRPS